MKSDKFLLKQSHFPIRINSFPQGFGWESGPVYLEKVGLTNPVSEALVKEKVGPRDHRKPFYLDIHREPNLLA